MILCMPGWNSYFFYFDQKQWIDTLGRIFSCFFRFLPAVAVQRMASSIFLNPTNEKRQSVIEVTWLRYEVRCDVRGHLEAIIASDDATSHKMQCCHYNELCNLKYLTNCDLWGHFAEAICDLRGHLEGSNEGNIYMVLNNIKACLPWWGHFEAAMASIILKSSRGLH